MPPDPAPDVFLAHASADEAWAREVHAALSARGLVVFLDVLSIPPGALWDEALVTAQASAKATVVLLSPGWDKALYLRDEIIRAVALARQGRHLLLVFGSVDLRAEPPYGTAAFQSLVWGADTVDELASALRQPVPPVPPAPKPRPKWWPQALLAVLVGVVATLVAGIAIRATVTPDDGGGTGSDTSRTRTTASGGTTTTSTNTENAEPPPPVKAACAVQVEEGAALLRDRLGDRFEIVASSPIKLAVRTGVMQTAAERASASRTAWVAPPGTSIDLGAFRAPWTFADQKATKAAYEAWTERVSAADVDLILPALEKACWP